MIFIFILYLLYASIFVIGKFAIHIAQPVFLTGMRMVCAGLISYGIHKVLYYSKSQFRLLSLFDCLILVLLAIFNVYITNAGEFWALQYLSAGKTSFIYNVSPFFVLIFSAFIFKERVSTKKIFGMIIGFTALMPMLINTPEIIDTTRHCGWLSVAEIIMICASAATALGWTLMKYFVHKEVFTPYFLNGISMTLGGIMCLIHAYIYEQRPLIIAGNLYDFIWYMSLMMVIQNIVAYNLHAYLLRYHSATLIALFSFVMPLITVVMGNALLNEPITSIFIVCSIGVALGLFIFYQEELTEYHLGK